MTTETATTNYDDPCEALTPEEMQSMAEDEEYRTLAAERQRLRVAEIARWRGRP